MLTPQSGFDAGSLTDLILLASLPYSASDSVTLGAGNVLTMMLNGSAYTLDFNSAQNFSGHAFSAVNSNGDVAIVDPVVSNGGNASTKGVPALQDLWGTKSFAASMLGLPVDYNATSESLAPVSSGYLGGMESADLSGFSRHHSPFPGIHPGRPSIEDEFQSDHYARFNIKQP